MVSLEIWKPVPPSSVYPLGKVQQESRLQQLVDERNSEIEERHCQSIICASRFHSHKSHTLAALCRNSVEWILSNQVCLGSISLNLPDFAHVQEVVTNQAGTYGLPRTTLTLVYIPIHAAVDLNTFE